MAADPIPVNPQAMDVRILQSIPTPVADSLLSRGRKTAADVLSRPEALTEVLAQHHVADPELRTSSMLAACRQEAAAKDAWHSADSALSLLQKGKATQPLRLPCAGLNGLLGSALQGGGTLLEVCGLPGSGKTQFCLPLGQELCWCLYFPLAAVRCSADLAAPVSTPQNRQRLQVAVKDEAARNLLTCPSGDRPLPGFPDSLAEAAKVLTGASPRVLGIALAGLERAAARQSQADSGCSLSSAAAGGRSMLNGMLNVPHV
ncbi:unnamed protein product [Symbiodinium natans]|uniref:Uncharacterized protein n=1 Tax=Symbiodinium natans TaxID=878477 RepID=A0A812Q4U2_9DINO|nr:unnamed protein product [Symbiodinium natans]